MIDAYILLSLHPGNIEKTIEQLRHIPCLQKISIVSGQYDIVVRVSIENLENLLHATNKIQLLPSIEKTNTQIIIKEIVP